jgi:N-methylhydantoinase B
MSMQAPAAPTAAVDPITTEVIRSALVAITDEMKTNLMRTAYNMIIYESLDYTVGLFDADGNTVSIGLGLPMFIRGLSDAIKTKLAHYGKENIHPGDVLLTNDSYIHGSHLNHFIFTLPIFWEGELVAFAASMGHWQDVGGTLRGVTTDIYEEGLQLPICKIYRQGQVNPELVEIIKSNVRFPDLAMGDFRAQASGAWSPCSAAMAATRSWAASPASSRTAARWRGRRCGPSRTASTRPRALWTTTACASASPSPCASA